jgi:type IV pilus assembly protein PilB
MKPEMLSIKDRVLKILCDKKLVTANDIKNALEVQKEKGGKLSDILIGMGLVTRDDLVSALSQELSTPPIDLTRYKISPDVIKLIPKKIAKNYSVMPVSRMGNRLTVATADPLNVLAVDDIAAVTGHKISVVIAREKDIEDAIIEYYEAGTHEAIERIIDDITPDGDIEIVEEGGDTALPAQMMKLTEEAPVVKIANMILTEAVRMKASDILIEPLEHTMRIRYRIDGLLQDVQRPPKKIHQALVLRLKVLSSLNIAERRLPQDGRFKAKIQNREVDFRISVLPSSGGEKVALRILDKAQATLDLDRLGFEQDTLENLKKAAARPHGMILSCGPTGCGKTTTLYSVLKLIDAPEKNIITAENPVEYQLEGINQLSVRPELGLTFASSLRSFLRQDPDIIMVGEIRDFETVDIAIKAALTGHLVLSTLHTTTASGSIVRLVNMGVEPAVAKELQIKPGEKPIAYRGRGCKACNKTGYRGRVGLIETLVMTHEIRKLILETAQEHVIRDQARREGMNTLRGNGVRKVLKGITTIEEVVRVTVGEQEIAV